MAKMSDYIKPHPGPQQQAFDIIGSGKVVFYGGARSGGKLSPLDSIVYTPFGERRMGDLEVGDTILNPNGSPQKIIQIHPHNDMDIYELEFEDGAKLEVGLDHLWLTHKTSSHKTKVKENGYLNDDEFGNGIIMDTREIISWLDKKASSDDNSTIKKQHLCIPLCRPLTFTRSYRYDPRTIHPYILGVLIGDGSLTHLSQNRVSYTGIDQEIADKIISLGYKVVVNGKNNTIVYPKIKDTLGKLGLDGSSSATKFIPECYKYTSIEQRKELVQGLMDTDGYIDSRGHMSYTTISETLAKDFQWLIRSLGGKANICKSEAGYKNSDGEFVQCRDAYTVYFNTKINPELVHLSRKKNRASYDFNSGISDLYRRIVGYKYIGKKDARCITVSHPNQLYVANDFIVTHNSWLALAAAVYVAKKYPGIQIGMMRHTFNELEEVFINKLLANYPDNVWGYKYRDKQHTATFSNKSRIIFRSCETEKDARKAQGVEYQFLVIDEAVNFMPELIQRLLGSCRNAHVKNFKPTVLMTGNPGGMSDQWFIDHFVNPNYSKWEPGELDMVEDYVFIPAKVGDNPSVDSDYIRKLSSLPEHLRRAWLDGDWGVFDGKFFEAWDQEVHVIAERDIPKTWHICAGFDLGYTKQHPTVCLWGAQNPDTGDIIVFDEYVGVGAVETHVRPVAEINAIHGDPLIYADPSMWNKSTKLRESDSCPADMFAMSGVPFLPANNERINGWRMIKSWLNHTVRRPSKLYVTERCTQLITTIGTLRYSKGLGRGEDLDTKMADDAADALRYMIISGFGSPLESDIEHEARQELRDIRAIAAESQRYSEDTYNDYRGYDFLEDTRVLYTNY